MSSGFSQPPKEGRSPRSSSFASKLAYLWQAPPDSELENSIPLRGTVQLLVIVGIISLDIAATDVLGAPLISLWAVPMSIVGGVWSWRQRRKANIPIKFCIAIAMLVALAAFFVRLVGESNDTRLVLAELLIQLQVFHSFDLPRRKDLGYSLVIGLILLGVAATLSQTLVFAPVLLVFVAIAIPVLMLDYRSRLGVVTQSFRGIQSDLSIKRLGTFLLVIMALGLGIFAIMPRFPGYQLRNFPVSSPVDFQGEFNAETIVNPGYVRDGTGNGVGEGVGETGSGQVDDTFYYGFSSQINQNLRGQLTPKVVMRVRSQAEGFMRVLAFDRYTGQGWEISRNTETDVTLLERPSWTFRYQLPLQITRGPKREVIQTYTVVSELPNLVPMMYEARQIYFPTRELGIDLEGSVRSPVPLSEGFTYTVVSDVALRDRTGLRNLSQNYPAAITGAYLDVPPELQDRLRQTTQDILDRAPTPLMGSYEQTLYLTQYLKQNYTLQNDLPFFGENEDLVEAFLYRYQGGYPDHFSTVLTLMLRSVGIPARLTAGFLPGQFNPFTGYYVVRNIDALALTEVYFGGFGWFTFNPIPGMEAIPPSVSDYETFGVLRQFWNWVAGWLPSPVTGLVNFLIEWIAGLLAWGFSLLTVLFNRGWVGIVIGAVIATGLGALGWLGWSSWNTWRYRLWLSKLPPMEALYQQMLTWLDAQGIAKQPTQTPLEFSRQVQHRTDALSVVDEISHAYSHWRYGGHSADVGYLRQRFRSTQKAFRRKRRETSSPPQRTSSTL